MTDSTDNARGPERIWAESKTCTVDASGASRLLAMDREFSRGTEYIRADLAPDPLADPRVVAMRNEIERLRYVLGGVRGAIKTGRNEPLVIWTEQIDIALAALSPTGGNADGHS